MPPPPPPSFTPNLRLAQLSDLPRIGLVAAAGFHSSGVFQLERPGYNRYPRDTVASYRSHYRTAILDPDVVVLVAVGTYKQGEVDEVYDALSVVYEEVGGVAGIDVQEERKSAQVIVGVASLSLKADGVRHGEFLPDESDASAPTKDMQDLGRDHSREAVKFLTRFLYGPERMYSMSKHRLLEFFILLTKRRWLHDRLEIVTIVVHPAYWREGHGSKLARWCMQLAAADSIGLGVSAVRMGRDLFCHLGFEDVEVVSVVPHEKKLLSLWICVLDQPSKPEKIKGPDS